MEKYVGDESPTSAESENPFSLKPSCKPATGVQQVSCIHYPATGVITEKPIRFIGEIKRKPQRVENKGLKFTELPPQTF